MIRNMEPRELLQQLMDRDGLNSSSLAVRLNNATTQPQIHKFLSGVSKEPRRSTLAPIAAHFRIPLDALYDRGIAEITAKQKQLIGVESNSQPPGDIRALQKIYERVPHNRKTDAAHAAMVAMLGFVPDSSLPTPAQGQPVKAETPSEAPQAAPVESKTL